MIKPMDDVIELRGLRLTAIVGVLPAERVTPQPLELDLDVHVDLSAAGQSDDLTDTVDYSRLCDLAAQAARTEPYLLEHLAARVAETLLGADSRIDAVDVAVRKLRPPVPHDLATSGVRIRRRRTSMTQEDG